MEECWLVEERRDAINCTYDQEKAIQAQITNNALDLISVILRGDIVSLHKLHIKAYNLSLKKKRTHNLWIFIRI